VLNFTLASMEIDTTRSPDTDTDLIAISYTAAKWPIQQANNLLSIVSYGEGVHNIGLTFSPVPVELCEPVVFVYSIVNCGNSDSTAVMATMQKSGADYIDTALKSLPNATNSLIISAAETGSAAILGSLLGPGAALATRLISAGVDELISGLTGLFFQNCDGAVAIEAVGFQKARELQQMIRTQGVNSVSTAPATVHENLDAPSGGNKSLYKVTWAASEA
jgi:hypothetical protein